MTHHLPLTTSRPERVAVTQASAGWRFLRFHVRVLRPGEVLELGDDEHELALVPLSGALTARVGDERYALARAGVFAQLPHVLYLPPGARAVLEAGPDGAELAHGGAPAEGRLPVRLFRPDEMRREVRGGGAARREVHHVLAPPLPAERLILYEVYVPGGMWSGIPPHCHDGRLGSPYLEEVYHYRFDRPAGFGLHRNYTREGDLDEAFTVSDGDTVLVPGGFHPVAVAPGCNAYFLNYLAGELEGEARATPPVDDPDFAPLKDDWQAGTLPLPLRLRE